MNYRHAFHAGSFADVIKHATLVRILVHLRAKPAPFRVIDTHAGAGRYDLDDPDAGRSAEWREGIARLLAAAPSQGAKELLAPYFEAVGSLNPSVGLTAYPGSPLLVRAFLRERDRLIACELEPRAAAALARNLRSDRRCKAIAIDGWTAVNAYIPPKERRGLVLIDPPFEEPADFERLGSALEAAHRKWASGIYLLWYPLKERKGADALARRLCRSGFAKILRAEVNLPKPRNGDKPRKGDRLSACGLVIVNPPWTLEGELRLLLPEFVAAFSQRDGGGHRLEWLPGQNRTLSPPRNKLA
jgi:23S rRNA (adenine2030-N6)-methyltransferase